MRSRTPKVLHPLCGRPALAYVIDAARDATGSLPIVVYSPATAQLCEVFRGQAIFAFQSEPRGTGDALRSALAALPDETDELVVLNGDLPLIRPETIQRLLEHRHRTAAPMALVWTESDPKRYGRVVLDDGGNVIQLVEFADASKAQRALRRWNVGVYAFERAWVVEMSDRLTPSPATGEIYLTGLVEIARATDARVAAIGETEAERLEGLDDRVQFARAEAYLRQQLNEQHLRAGVTMEDPATTYLDATVELAEDVVLEPNVMLRGSTRVGRDTVIGSGSQILDSAIGERCLVRASVLESCEVGDDVRIGPFAHLRPGASIGDRAEIGNFAEVKQSRVGAGSKQHHFSYLGDAELGENVNVGAGTVTANYDGARKARTVIGDGAFIGSDTILRAPVTLGAGSATGAGSVVTRDVPPGKLAVGVPARIRERGPKREEENSG